MLDEFLKNELSLIENLELIYFMEMIRKNLNIALEFSAELFSRNIENID